MIPQQVCLFLLHMPPLLLLLLAWAPCSVWGSCRHSQQRQQPCAGSQRSLVLRPLLALGKPAWSRPDQRCTRACACAAGLLQLLRRPAQDGGQGAVQVGGAAPGRGWAGQSAVSVCWMRSGAASHHPVPCKGVGGWWRTKTRPAPSLAAATPSRNLYCSASSHPPCAPAGRTWRAS